MADIIPPAPVDAPFGSYNWQDWYFKVRNAINQGADVQWSQIVNFTGSNLTQIQTRNHNDLQNIQGGAPADYYHLTLAQRTALLALPVTASGTYTATATAIANCTILTSYTAQYLRVGNIVSVTGQADVNVTASATATVYDIALPIASVIAATDNAHGVMGAAALNQTGAILAQISTAKARVQFLSTSTGGLATWFTFQYVVI